MSTVIFDLYLEEPVKMARQGSQTVTETLTYLSGSSIRGAIIGKYMENNHLDKMSLSEKDEERNLLLKNTKYYNAYPVENGEMLIPTPMVFYADKHALRRNR